MESAFFEGLPAFSLTAVFVLALGIGVNLTAFRLLLFETAPNVRNPDSLVEVERWFPNGMGNTIAYPVLAFYAEHARSFAAVIGSEEESVEYTSGPAPETMTVNFVSASYFAEEAPPLSYGRGLSTGLDEGPVRNPQRSSAKVFGSAGWGRIRMWSGNLYGSMESPFGSSAFYSIDGSTASTRGWPSPNSLT